MKLLIFISVLFVYSQNVQWKLEIWASVNFLYFALFEVNYIKNDKPILKIFQDIQLLFF